MIPLVYFDTQAMKWFLIAALAAMAIFLLRKILRK